MRRYGVYYVFNWSSSKAEYRYNEAIQLLKGTNDILWQATAMEGIATITVIDAWSVGQGLVSENIKNFVGLASLWYAAKFRYCSQRPVVGRS